MLRQIFKFAPRVTRCATKFVFNVYFLSVLVFVLVYCLSHLIWFTYFELWTIGWPASRARFVIFVVTVPLWGMGMLLLTFGLPVIQSAVKSIRQRRQRPRSGTALEMEASEASEGLMESVEWHEDDGESLSYAKTPRSPPKSRFCCDSKATILYCVAVAAGMLLLATYEQPLDVRYRDIIRAAARSPKRSGYGNGGKLQLNPLQRHDNHLSYPTEKIFIAANFYDNESILPHWIREMTKVISYLGAVRLVPCPETCTLKSFRTMFSYLFSNHIALTALLPFCSPLRRS